MVTLTLWLKIVHFCALFLWSAGLFALPVLLGAYPHERHPIAVTLLRARSRFGYVAVISPAAIVAIVSGTLLIYASGAHGGWLPLKLTVVSLMVVFHVSCGALLTRLQEEPEAWRASTLYALVLAPIVLIPIVLWLALAKPF